MSDEEQDIKYILHTRQRTPTCNSTDGSEYHPPTPDPTPRSKRARQSSVKGEDQKPWVEISDDDHFDVKGGGKLGRKSSNNQGIRGNRTGKRGRPAGVGRGDSSRKMGSWTKEEVRQLWDAMGFLPVKVKWEDVASKVDGRDKLSCSNKWRYDMLPKLQAFIDSLGE